MTHPTPSDRATGVKTDGTSHLNLTRTMADVWAAEVQERMSRRAARRITRRPYRPRSHRQLAKIGFAGREVAMR